MPFQFKLTVSRVGNSNMLILPKPLCDQYGIEKGMELPMIATDSGLYIPLKAKPIDNDLIEALESDIQKTVQKPTKKNLTEARTKN